AVRFSRPRSQARCSFFAVPPPPSMADIANDCLYARVHVHMLDRYVLLALAPFSRQGFDLHGVGAHEFGCQLATAPRVRATNSSKAIFVTAMGAAMPPCPKNCGSKLPWAPV